MGERMVSHLRSAKSSRREGGAPRDSSDEARNPGEFGLTQGWKLAARQIHAWWQPIW